MYGGSHRSSHNGHHTRHHHGSAALAAPPGDKYERFEAWLRENGGQFDLVGFANQSAPMFHPFPRALCCEVFSLLICSVFGLID